MGATGRSGRLILDEAVTRCFQVRALARDPSRIAHKKELVTVVRGEATDPAAVDELVSGCDAVVSALGIVKGGRTDVCSKGTENALAAMRKHGVRRYVVIGGAGSAMPGEVKPLPGKLIHAIMGVFMGALLRDKERELELLSASDLDWTVARPPLIGNGPKVPVRTDARFPKSGKISYASLAAFVVEEVEARRHVRSAPYVAA